jgi:hypothetical protein
MLSGLEESGVNLTGNTFRIYPNPTSGQFTIEQTGNKPADHVKVEVIGTIGGRILSTELSGFTKHELSIRGNAPGIYFVKITSEDKSQTVKIILTN